MKKQIDRILAVLLLAMLAATAISEARASLDLDSPGGGITETIYVEEYAGRSANGTTQDFARNATMTRTAAGQWTVAFSTPHADGVNYAVTVTAEEQAANRDTPDITIVQGSQAVTGFSVQITTGDNGGTADVYVDTPWNWSVDAPQEVLTP